MEITVAAAFRAEAEQLSAAMLAVKADDWARPTRCAPWTTAELLGHVVTVIAWIPGMLADQAPEQATVGVVDYYRADERFSSATNAQRIDLARQRAASAQSGAALALELDRVWRQIAELCDQEPPGRVVRTRHGDAMVLTDFLTTRIVELGIHGLDLAAALNHRPWLTPAASRILTDLLLGQQHTDPLSELDWDELTFLSKATGRQPLTADEARRLRLHGIRWLTLG